MFWVLKRTVTSRAFFGVPTTYVLVDKYEKLFSVTHSHLGTCEITQTFVQYGGTLITKRVLSLGFSLLESLTVCSLTYRKCGDGLSSSIFRGITEN